jgi:hypothetical protein
MGGKTTTSKQQVKIPKEVLARYNSVNERAESVASNPFKEYSQNPNDFVAGMNQDQMDAMSMTRGYGQRINDLVNQGTGDVGMLTEEDINRYMSPYLNDVVNNAMKSLDYTQGQEMSGNLGNAIMAGAFGGDRGGVSAANLKYSQDMARGNTLSNLLNQGYGQAVGVAQGQQGVQAANFDRKLQGAGIEGSVGLGAANQLFNQGSVGQQTDQAGKTALYNQFQQEQAFPYQQAQFLADIAEGTGSLSGNTTKTTQPTGFFSDRRLKTDIRRVGHTDDGMPIYKYKYKGDPNEQTHIGLMADEVEERHPEAVGVAAGYKTVDYDKATPKAGGGGVMGMYGGAGLDIPMGGGGGQHSLSLPGQLPSAPASGMEQANDFASNAAKLMTGGKEASKVGKEIYNWFNESGQKDDAYDLAGVSRATGGVVPGEPEDDKLIDIPHSSARAAPPTAAAPPKPPESGLSQAISMGKDVADIASKIVPLFLATGGVASLPDDDTIETSGLAPAAVPEPKGMEPTYDNLLHSSKHAIGTIESSGNYKAVGPETKRHDGSVDRPYGKYQVMGANIPEWTQAALGKPMTPEEYLNDEKAQDAVFDHQFGSYIKKTGNAMDAASMWFTGQPRNKVKTGAKDVLGTSAPAYLNKFVRAGGVSDSDGLAAASIAPASDEAPSADPSIMDRIKGMAHDAMPSSPEGKMALLAGVFGALASPNHYLLQAIGSGGLAGVETYRNMAQLKNQTNQVRNETFKNTMGLVSDRFATVDGKTYIDRFTGQTMSREQYMKALNGMFAAGGIDIGGMGVAGGTHPSSSNPVNQIVQTMPPASAAPDTSVDTGPVGTSKAVLSTPPETPAGPPTNPLEVQTSLLNDPSKWTNVPDTLNTPKLFAQSQEQLKLAQTERDKAKEWQAKASDPYTMAANPKAAEQYVALANQANQRADGYIARATTLREQGQSALDNAAKLEVQKMTKGVDAQFEMVPTQPEAGGPTLSIPKSKALSDANAGVPVISAQNPIETETMNVQPTPTGPVMAMPKKDVLAAGKAGNPLPVSQNPIETETMEVQPTPTGPKQVITKRQAIDAANAGKPVTAEQSPTETDLVAVQPTPNDPVTMVPKKQLIEAANAGKPIVTKPSDTVATLITKANANEADMGEENRGRRPLVGRLQAIEDVVEKYETGAWDNYKSEILGHLRAAGFDVPQNTTASVQEIIKDSTKQVYDQAKQIGNKVLVAEIEGLTKTVPGVGLQPDANRVLLGQMKGLLNWEQQFYNDYMGWRHDPKNPQNVNDPYPDVWINKWLNSHPVADAVHKATLTVAPKGMSKPPKDKLEDGQRVNLGAKGIWFWDAKDGHFVDKAPVRQ